MDDLFKMNMIHLLSYDFIHGQFIGYDKHEMTESFFVMSQVNVWVVLQCVAVCCSVLQCV